MLKGDLSVAGLPAVLAQLADGSGTGCLHVKDPAGEEARVFFRSGKVYAVALPDARPQLGSRLVSSGALAPEALAEAQEAQRTELQGWRLGELLVHMGYVDQPIVEAVIAEQLRDAVTELLTWTKGTWRFRINERTREDVAPPNTVAQLLEEVSQRHASWLDVLTVIHDVESVPFLSSADNASDETAIDPDAWSLLCKVDGMRTVAELARDCGFTLYEGGHVICALARAGLLEIEDDADEPLAVEEIVEAEVAADPRSAAARMLQAFESPAEPEPWNEEDVEGSISRVSKALSAMLGPARSGEDAFTVHRKPPLVAPRASELTAEELQLLAKKAEREERDRRRRQREASEAAATQAELEQARRAAEAARPDAVIHDLEQRREGVRAASEQAALDQARDADLVREAEAEATRLAEEAEQARLAAGAAEAARLAEEAEAARLAAEAAEAARLAEEAEAARLAAEAAEAARLAE
ncbi:MAG: hypothetical protein JWL64_2652, partial [Frankiales bacterium]|nr:hypothetical protein [Frankiales bacterium]